MTGKRKRSSISATDLMAQLQNDPEYQRKIRDAEEARQARAQMLRRAERPIVADLRAAGVDVDSVWDLVNTSVPYPAALPVLIEHLDKGGYPERVMESLGRALAVKPAVRYWDRLKARYLNARDSGEEDGCAVALAASATRAQLNDLIGFLALDERGTSRTYFLRPIKRLGGDAGRSLLKSLLDDPTFGKEAAALLGGSPKDG